MKRHFLENKANFCVKRWVLPCFLLLFYITAAQNATITGVVLNDTNTPLSNATVSTGVSGTVSNENGEYLLEIFADVPLTITFSHIGYKNVVVEHLILTTNETFEFNPILKSDAVQIAGVEVSATGQRNVQGITTLAPELLRKIPGANAGVENLLKLLPGVSFNNELSTQYNVRGGNFDENLVYVNGIEVYRPFLIRSAQQEGFSFVNSSMISNLEFSAGGFQAKYGDKLSSVLDINYKIPSAYSVQMEASLLGAGLTVETVSKKKDFTSITGIRYRNNSLLINSQQTQTTVVPTFIDVQSFLVYQLNDRLSLNFLGNFSLNDYQNEPITRQTNFGTLLEPRALLVFYEGQENNRFQTTFGALKANYTLNEKTKLEFTSSIYHTIEEEFSDIIASYELGDIDTNLASENLGEVTDSRGIGSQQNRARNQLDALIVNFGHSGVRKQGAKTIRWGLRYSHEDFRDQLRESEFLDSAGIFIRPPNPEFANNEPQEPFEAPIEAFESVRATNFAKTNRISGYFQFDNRVRWGTDEIYYNLGIRAQQWSLSGQGLEKNTQFLWSPRAQFAIKPGWKKDMLFRMAIGSYQQPPFYRELRNASGIINPNVEAQKSIHALLGSEYSFILWDRPFTLIGEAYYKDLYNVNPYTIEDVRIRYVADNNATAFVYGFDFRLNGAFVPGAESWVSIGYVRAEENIDNRGFISRPTDSRFKLGVLFQDYMPSIPDLKLYLNLVYNTGVPGGSPNNADPYEFQNRLRDYRRADLGISYIFAGKDKTYPKGHWLNGFKELSTGFEIFNLFNNQNSITNTWVRDADTQQQFAIPNFLTSRIFNLRVGIRF